MEGMNRKLNTRLRSAAAKNDNFFGPNQAELHIIEENLALALEGVVGGGGV